MMFVINLMLSFRNHILVINIISKVVFSTSDFSQEVDYG